MAGRGSRIYRRRDNQQVISDHDKYLMLLLYQHQKMSIQRIAHRFSLDPVQVRVIIGKRSGGSCCG